MVRQKSSLNKKPLIPKSSRKRKTPSSENSSLEAIHHIKEAYDGHICQGCKWLQSHTGSSSTIPASIVKDIYNNPRFKDAFENILNHYSDKALALYLSWRGFHENQSWSTVEGVHAAFKKLDGDMYHKKWHYNEAQQCWEGNPATSAKVDDVMASIKHKVSTEGCDCMHSSAMKKEYMDKILTWSMMTCPELESVLHFIGLVLTRSASASSLHGISDNMKKHITWYLGLLAFASTAWIIWTRCFELIMDATLVNHVLTRYLRGKQDTLTTNERDVYYEIHLRNQKGWQKKLTIHAIIHNAAAGNCYKIYPQLDLTSCDSFFWLVVWVRWVKHVQLGWAMVDGDYIFPAIGANGVLKPCKPLSQDAVQKWISEATMGTGIEVRWWGGWADSKHHDMLICYLLDELHSYKNDHSDALGPFLSDMSLAGEHALATPATRKELQMFQSSVSTEIHKLDNNIQAILRNNFTTCSSAPPVISALGTNHTSPCYMFPQPPAVLPSLVTMESDTLTYLSPSPFIPDILFTHADRMITPRNKAWRDVIQHWGKGVPEKRLPPLRDWPYEYTHGPNHNLQSKYNQQCIIALEFLDCLLHAITAACQQQGEAEI
ncbi:hypothetical protein V8B97DRAFT_2027250 [Scleroderma yunnanense]